MAGRLAMNRTMIVGSPRADGRSAHLAQQIFEAYIEDCPEDGVSMISLAGVDIAPCMGCDACKAVRFVEADSTEDGQDAGETSTEAVRVAAESDASRHVCVLDDEMAEVRKLLDAADELIVIAPLYFAGAPAQMKALMDRLQPYFWSDIRRSDVRRPMELHIVGEGGNPYGYDALVTTVRSAFGAVGFRLVRLLDWVGKIGDDGDILSEAEETLFQDALK